MISFFNKEKRRKRWREKFKATSKSMIDDYRAFEKETGASSDEVTYVAIYRLMEHSKRLGILTKVLIGLTVSLIALTVFGFLGVGS